MTSVVQLYGGDLHASPANGIMPANPVCIDNGGRLYVRLPADVLGDEFGFNVVAPKRAAGANPVFTDYAIKSSEGFLAFEITAPKLPTDEFLVVAWSTTLDDETALAANLDAYCLEIESGIGVLKCGAISPSVDKCTLAGETMAHVWDGLHTIKTILSVIVKLGSVTPAAAVFYAARVVQAT